jgi:hypothetical protein
MFFVTYNQALMWDRLERICVIAAAIALVGCLESLGSNPSWIFLSLAGIGGQVLVLKCWADTIIMSRPFENCWNFRG